MQKRTLGQYENNQWVSGQGGLGELLTGLKIRYDMLKGQMGFNNPQTETGRFSLRSDQNFTNTVAHSLRDLLVRSREL
jgi:hypothetical protein